MKGAIATLQLIVLTVIALLIGVFFLNVAYGSGKDLYNKGVAAKTVAGNPGEITYKTNIPPTIIAPPVVKHIYTALGASDPLRPSEVACHMADDIYNDFTTNGVSDRGTICFKETDSPYHYCFINNGLFEMSKGSSDELNPTWINDLTSRNCKLCSNGTASNGGMVVPELDEVCINDNLDRSYNGQNFCGYGPFIDTKGDIVAFSNCDCGNGNLADAAIKHGNNNVNGWNNYCNGNYGGCRCFLGICSSSCWNNCGPERGIEFCDNGNLTTYSDKYPSAYNANNMIYWNAEIGGSKENQYIVSDHILEQHESFGQYGEYDYYSLNKSPNQYEYGLYWIPEEKRYYLFFERVPASKTETNFNFLINNIYEINSGYPTGDAFSSDINQLGIRFSPLGYDDAGARRVMDRIVTPQSNISIFQLEKDVAAKLGTGLSGDNKLWEIDGSPNDCSTNNRGSMGVVLDCIYKTSCDGVDDCINYSPLPPDDSTWKTNFEQLFGSVSLFKYLVDYGFTFRIDSSIKDDTLQAGKSYRVTLNYWTHPYENSNKLFTFDKIDKSIDIYEMSPEICGGSGQTCCSSNPLCALGLFCNSTTGTCQGLCGDSGQPCCTTGSPCKFASLSCTSGVCQQLPKDCTGFSTLTWTGMHCQDKTACPGFGYGNSCSLYPFGCTLASQCCCVQGCGQFGYPCCASSPNCQGSLTCDSTTGTCQNPCGTSGQACCSGNICNSGLTCTSGKCQTCGASGQSCCVTGNPCNSGLECTLGVCQSPLPTTCTDWPGGSCSLTCPSPPLFWSLYPFGCTMSGAGCCLNDCGKFGIPCCASSPHCSGSLACDSTTGTCQNPPPWSFSMALSPTTGAATVGTPSSHSIQITVTTSGTPQPVDFSYHLSSVAGLLILTQAAPCTPNPTCTSTFTMDTTTGTPASTYQLTVTGTSPGASQASATYTLTVSSTAPPPSSLCSDYGGVCTLPNGCTNTLVGGNCTGAAYNCWGDMKGNTCCCTGFKSPPPTCGDYNCQSSLGEDQANCCTDCGCTSGTCQNNVCTSNECTSHSGICFPSNQCAYNGGTCQPYAGCSGVDCCCV